VTGVGNAGGRVGTAFYRTAGSRPKDIGANAAKEAVLLLSAVNPVPGDQPVVLGSKNSGVVVHEAVGHPFEADGVWRKTSIMWDKLGTEIASPLVTIYDDATIPHSRGSLNVDDEGTFTRKAMLVEKGKLVGYLYDRLSARLLGVESNGHGRRSSFRRMPIPRMNNTILARGDSEPEEIIKSVKKGFFAESYTGGMVQGTGKFTFSVNLGYLIEDGKLTAPVKNATLIGTNVQVLKEIEMVGNDMDYFLGTCGKGGQGAPVTAGTPTFKVREMTVGGRA
jgi:TldD protein